MERMSWWILCYWHFVFLIPYSDSKEEIIREGNMLSWYQSSYMLNGSGLQWTTPQREKGFSSKTCGHGKANFWLITNHVNLDHVKADSLYLDVWSELSAICERKQPCLFKSLQLYVFRGNSKPEVPFNPGAKSLEKERGIAKTFLQNNFVFIGNITSNTTLTRSELQDRNETDRKQTFAVPYGEGGGMTFAIQSKGACGKIFRLKMYYYSCEETYEDGVKFDETVSPANGAKEVFGNCSENSVFSRNQTMLGAFCHSNGTWSFRGDTLCLCNAGYEHSSAVGCSRCLSNHYKATASNTKCSKCPSNRFSSEDQTTCECKAGYYKRSTNRKSLKMLPCYALVKIDNKPDVYSIEDDSFNVTWLEPTDTNGINEPVFYDVKCYLCLETECPNPSTYTEAVYTPRWYNLTQTHVVVSNLKVDQTYMFRVFAKNSLNDVVPKEDWVFVATDPQTLQRTDKFSQRDGFPYLVIIVCVVCATLLIAVSIVVFILRRKKEARCLAGKYLNVELPSAGQKMYVDPTNYDSPEDAVCEFASELDPSILYLETLIGAGEFGDVYKGSMMNIEGKKVPVAVKTLKKNATPKGEKDFLLEASVMGQFSNPNVVRLEGVVTKYKPAMIVIEFMSNGSLDNFLKANDGSFSHVELITMAKGVAEGMEYLAGINFVHRDLAARNILVNDAMVCKVSDFGLSRELESTDSSRGEYATTGGRIPIRWTAPEAIKYRKFSSASDVWSFGILLWEIMSFGLRPYWEWDNFRVMEKVDEGFRLPAPLNCPKGVHDVMLQCWKKDRPDRPSFSDLVAVIDGWIQNPKSMEGDIDIGLGKWLQSLKMGDYLAKFTAAGYHKPSELFELKEEDLKKLGISLVGHRNKILKGIKALQTKNRKPQRVLKREVSIDV